MQANTIDNSILIKKLGTFMTLLTSWNNYGNSKVLMIKLSHCCGTTLNEVSAHS